MFHRTAPKYHLGFHEDIQDLMRYALPLTLLWRGFYNFTSCRNGARCLLSYRLDSSGAENISIRSLAGHPCFSRLPSFVEAFKSPPPARQCEHGISFHNAFLFR